MEVYNSMEDYNSVIHKFNLIIYEYYFFIYSVSSIKIQKIYKGYYIRKKIKIFYKLPREIQKKIIWHINYDIYLRHFNCSLSKLIYRRYNEFYYNNFKCINILNNIYVSYEINDKLIYDLINLIKLSIKYYPILNIKKIPKINFVKNFAYFKIKNLISKNSIEYNLIKKYEKLF